MGRMNDLVVEIAGAVAGVTGDVVAVVDAVLDGRVELAAREPSGGVLPGSFGTVIDRIAGSGVGLVARIDGGPWVTVREVASVDDATPGAVLTGVGHRSANGQIA